MDRGETFGLTPWHVMERYDGTRGSERHGGPCERHWVGYFLAPDCEYRYWKQDPYGGPANLVGGFVWQSERGEWSSFQCDVEACDLETTHRIVSEVPAEPIRDVDRWMASLRIDDSDRFVMHYAGLETASWEFFERSLRRDAPTVRALEAIDALVATLGGPNRLLAEGWDDLFETAYQAAMFHRGGDVACGERGVPLRDPSSIPGPLPDDVLEALRGFRTHADMLRHCTGAESQFAAALLSIVGRWQRGREPYAWTLDLVHQILELPATAIDWDEVGAAVRRTT